MWIFTSDSFLSIVAHREKPKHLLVRARLPGDIEELFPRARVVEMPDADYRFHAVVARTTVAKVVSEQVCSIDYRNFKATVDDPSRHEAYFAVWAAMRRVQELDEFGAPRMNDDELGELYDGELEQEVVDEVDLGAAIDRELARRASGSKE